jgi:ABC-type multidrug transport system permease subunit
MKKVTSLIKVTLKEFIRNWKSSLILIVLPLVLILAVFLSLSADGLSKIPAGVIDPDNTLKQYETDLQQQFIITKYLSENECQSDITEYKQYLCITVAKKDIITLTVVYDNTREPVIWEILARLENTIEYLQKEATKDMTSDFLYDFKTTLTKVENFENELLRAESEINSYYHSVDKSIKDLESGKETLEETIADAQKDLEQIKSVSEEISDNRANVWNSFYSETSNAINQLNSLQVIDANQLYYKDRTIDSIYELRREFEEYNNELGQSIQELDSKIYSYERQLEQGEAEVEVMEDYLDKLEDVKDDIREYAEEIDAVNRNIQQIQSQFSDVKNVDAEQIVNPIVMESIPRYVPNFNKQETEISVVKGINLIGLQTMYPIILFLIIIFLSLLLTSYITLDRINSAAYTRLQMIKHMPTYNYFATFIATHILLIIPTGIVILLGSFLFQLPIFTQIIPLVVIIMLVSSSFILLALLISFIIKKEAITLLTNSFILVFTIFISGFIFPIERMSLIAKTLALASPGTLGLHAFNKIVFYQQYAATEIISLFAWVIILGIISYIAANKYRK